ncbi:MAG: ROK family protein [Acidobacteriota bacterium]
MTRFAIGVDLGGTNLRVAAVNENGGLFDQISLLTQVERGREDVVERLTGGILELARRWKDRYHLVGIGVGVPGILRLKDGVLLASPNLPGWENFNVRALISRRLNSPFFLENDANAAALGEKWIGSGKNVDHLCFLTMGTGIGGGLILNGRIWHGAFGMAAELGHVTIYPDGRPCACGSRGCLEAYAAASAVVRAAQERLSEGKASPALKDAAASGAKLTSALIYQLARQGDESSKAIFAEVGRALGMAIANFINIFDAEIFVLGGGAVDAWDAFEASMFEEVAARSYVYRNDPRQIVKSSLGNQAGIFGAACLAFQNQA